MNKILFAEDILAILLAAKPSRTCEAPKDSRGIYGLIDHHGDIRYIGSTSAKNETLYKRIHQRHRTGSEGSSHYFSRMYNTGHMWRLRKDPATKPDGDIAKRLRNLLPKLVHWPAGAVAVCCRDAIADRRKPRQMANPRPDAMRMTTSLKWCLVLQKIEPYIIFSVFLFVTKGGYLTLSISA